jgi:hypothetical protein
MLFVKLMMKFANLEFRRVQCSPASCGNLVDPSPASPHIPQGRLQKAVPLHPMQQRVHGPWTYAIAMAPQFLHHGKPEDRFVSSVNEHVDANKAIEEFPQLG